MKKLLVFVLLSFVPVIAGAQEIITHETGRLINRIDGQTGISIKQTESTETFDRRTKPLLFQTSVQNAKSFTVQLHATTVTGFSGGAPEIAGDISTSSFNPINMVFERIHLHIDTNVASSICLCSCYADFLDTLPASEACQLGGNSTAWTFLFHPHSTQSISGRDSVVDYIKLTALTGDPGDTVSFTLTGIIMPASGVQDNQPKSVSSNPKITAIYPSPLTLGNSIKVKVVSPRESNLSYSIYDAVGRVVALGVTRQHIALGDNTVGIGSLDGLINGSYMLKLNFADGSSDSHFFQVMR